MTFDEIADAMDKQTDALVAALGNNITGETASQILELRMSAADCRKQELYIRKNEANDAARMAWQ